MQNELAPHAESQWLAIDELRPWEGNPRKNDGKPVDEVKDSIKRFGFVAPIIIWRSAGRMVAGHTRLKAMRELLKEDPTFVPKRAPGAGLVKVSFHEFDSEEEADLYAVADNKLGELAEWDDVMLRALVNRLHQKQVDLRTGTGMFDWQLNAMLEQKIRTCPPVEKETADDLAKRWKVDAGQLWEIPSETVEDGVHRVMCGDSTKFADVTRLTGGQHLDCIITDPPYELTGKVVIDACDFYAPRATIMTGGSQATQLLRDSRDWRYVLDLVWRHRTPRLDTTRLPIIYHQWILFLAKGKTKLGWKRPIATYGTVVEIEGAEFDFEFMGHGKACEIFATFIRGYSWKRWADPFLGSGSTLLACENTERVLYGMDINPGHVAATLERCVRAGLKPRLLKKKEEREKRKEG